MDYPSEELATPSDLQSRQKIPDSHLSTVTNKPGSGGSSGLPASQVSTLNAGLNKGSG